MQSEPSSGIKLTAYSCICWLFHRIYYDARNHKHKMTLYNLAKYKGKFEGDALYCDRPSGKDTEI